jgi:hypothetical protein
MSSTAIEILVSAGRHLTFLTWFECFRIDSADGRGGGGHCLISILILLDRIDNIVRIKEGNQRTEK